MLSSGELLALKGISRNDKHKCSFFWTHHFLTVKSFNQFIYIAVY